MANYGSNALAGAGTGAAAGAAAGPWGAVIGGAVGMIGGLLTAYEQEQDERKKQRIIEQAAKELGASQYETKKMFEDFYANNKSIGSQADVDTYGKMIREYDPNEFVYEGEDFDNNYDVNDYYAPNKEAIIAKTSDQLQHTAAGAGIGRGTGAANQIATGVAEKNESLYRDALQAMNQDRQFAYSLWNAKIQNGQNRLNALQNATNTQLNLYGNLANDFQEWNANKMQQQMDLQNQAAQQKLQLSLASI